MDIFKKYYSKQSLWTLFLMSALPIHIWAIFLALRDFDWVSDRTNTWDAVGVVSYGLIFAVLESIILFFFAITLGFFISNKWNEKKRMNVISALILILSLWAITSQFYFLQQLRFPSRLIAFIIATKYPLVVLYGIELIFVLFSFLIPAFCILKLQKVERIVQATTERLSLLMIFYLFFDTFALVIMAVRNL